MLSKGDAFWWDGHVWIVLSDPSKNAGEVLCVNLTTLDEECPDDECILHHSDYAWIEPNHPTVVAFSRFRIWNAGRLSSAIETGLVKIPNPKTIPPATVAIIAARGKASRELSRKAKQML